WKVVQDRPSEARFPDDAAYPSESMSEMQARALEAVREVDVRIAESHGKDAVWVAVSHGDVIKSILSHATGAHLDDFQRITIDPASVSVLRYTSRKPFVLRLNDVGGDLEGLRPPDKPAVDDGDAEVGGGSGGADPVG
ncbi:MAG: histidine phosphatase family protein, partial [Humibacillus sp.]